MRSRATASCRRCCLMRVPPRPCCCLLGPTAALQALGAHMCASWQRGSHSWRRCSSGCGKTGVRNDGTVCASCCDAYLGTGAFSEHSAPPSRPQAHNADAGLTEAACSLSCLAHDAPCLWQRRSRDVKGPSGPSARFSPAGPAEPYALFLCRAESRMCVHPQRPHPTPQISRQPAAAPTPTIAAIDCCFDRPPPTAATDCCQRLRRLAAAATLCSTGSSSSRRRFCAWTSICSRPPILAAHGSRQGSLLGCSIRQQQAAGSSGSMQRWPSRPILIVQPGSDPPGASSRFPCVSDHFSPV